MKNNTTKKQLKEQTLAAHKEMLERQSEERRRFLNGEGVVNTRYNKAAIKARLAYRRKNGKQLEQARQRSLEVRQAKRKARLLELEKTKKQEKRAQFSTGESKTRAIEKDARNQANRILSGRYKKLSR